MCLPRDFDDVLFDVCVMVRGSSWEGGSGPFGETDPACSYMIHIIDLIVMMAV